MQESIYTSKQYFNNNPNWHKEDSLWKSEKISSIITKNNIPHHKIIEVGCGAGDILKHLSIIYPETFFYGFDISPQAIELAKKNENNMLHYTCCNYLESLDLNKSYADILLVIDVIEHVENYFDFLRQVKLLASYKIIHIPLDIHVLNIIRNRFMVDRTAVGHIHYFTLETALASLVETGHTIIDWFYTCGSLELPRKTLQSFLLKYPNKFTYILNKNWAVRLFGGYSILVLTQ